MDPHFGLPNRDSVDVRIVWPGSGPSRIVQFLAGVAVGQRIVVNEQGSPTSVSLGGAGVDVPLGSGATLAIAPNPMRFAARITVVDGATAPRAVGPSSIEILDPSGRLVRTIALSSPRVEGARGARFADWDGRDSGGTLVAAGVYFARTGGAPAAAAARLVVLR
jgi:hypothetical protein